MEGVKTMQDLGYHNVEETGSFVVFQNLYDEITLYSDGEITFGEGIFVDQEVWLAIWREMVRRRWWKDHGAHVRGFVRECRSDYKAQPTARITVAINSNVSKYLDSLEKVGKMLGGDEDE